MNLHSPVKSSREFPQEIKNRTTIQTNTSGYIYKENNTLISKSYFHAYVHCSILHKSQGKETIQVSIGR